MPRKKLALGERPPKGAPITTTIDYERADDLAHAWLNFELDLPLETDSAGNNNFYIARGAGTAGRDPVGRLIDELNSPFRVPPKYFLGGTRGSGKSSELRRIASQPQILQRYLPIQFSMRDEADVNNLDYKDVLLAIGGRMYRHFETLGGKMPESLESELDRWRGRVMEVIVTQPRVRQMEMEGGLAAFFAHLGLRIKLEPQTRNELRQVIDHDVSSLIETINEIALVIKKQTRRIPLLLIDDTDKADIEASRALFFTRRETMLSPACAIVYTISDALFYMPEFEGIRDRALFLPNVALWDRAAGAYSFEGFEQMRTFVERRINPALITRDALTHAIRTSGGNYRELSRILRLSIMRANNTGEVRSEHVLAAQAEMRGEFRRMLSSEHHALLREAHATGQLSQPHKALPLLQMNALMEYHDHEPWCAVHPVLVDWVV